MKSVKYNLKLFQVNGRIGTDDIKTENSSRGARGMADSGGEGNFRFILTDHLRRDTFRATYYCIKLFKLIYEVGRAI